MTPVFLLFALILSFSVDVLAQPYSASTGAEYFDGYTFGEVETLAKGEDSASSLMATGNSEKVATNRLPQIENGNSSGDKAYKKVLNQPVTTPRIFQSMLDSIGFDVSPIQPMPAYIVQKNKVYDRVTFNPKDFTEFTALEPAQVNGVKGYLGTASRGGSVIMNGNAPQEFFITDDDYRKMQRSEVIGALDSINGANQSVHGGEEDCPENKEPYPEETVQQVQVPRVNGYLPGCQALAQKDLSAQHQDMLKQCSQSIKEAVASVSRNSSGGIDRSLWMCNVMAQLNPEEQEFAAMLFTAVGEGSIFLTSKETGEPKYKELAFIMKVIENRTTLLKEKMGNQYTSIDVALAPDQFSMYNKNFFNQFRHLFEPKSHKSDKLYDGAIKAFLALKENKIQPQPQVDHMYNYYNPNGMEEKYSSNRNLLINQGKIPANHPANKKVPSWNFKPLTLINDLNFDGRAVRKTPPYRHAFYSHANPGDEFGSRKDIKKRRSVCTPK
ncbi:MAG: hypothetical protein KDD34_00505 [Bdellovibrionales bacterium]|nr:hypothetical protein [Bdellovibrionales bacterium]